MRFACSLLLLCTSLGNASPPAKQPAPLPAMLVGTGVHFGPGKADVSAFLSQNRVLGTNTFRTDVAWWDLEEVRDQLMFPARLAPLEQAIDATVAAGGAPLLILDYGNQFHDNGSFPVSEEAQAAFVRYVRFVVSRFKGRVRHYEVWNEWNIGLATGHPVPYTYEGSARDYARLLGKVHAAIKAIDPGAVVIAGALANRDIAWMREMTAAASGTYDAISVHPYNFAARGAARTPEEVIQWIRGFRDALPIGPDQTRPPIYITEIGWPTHLGRHGTPEQMVAQYLARLLLLARETGFIKGVWWYDYQDDGDNPSEPEHHFGIVTRNGAPKPAFQAMRALASRVATARSASLRVASDGVLALQLHLADGTALLAAWSTTGEAGSSLHLASQSDTVTLRASASGAVTSVQTFRVGKGLPPRPISLSGTPLLITGDLRGVTVVTAPAVDTLPERLWLRLLQRMQALHKCCRAAQNQQMSRNPNESMFKCRIGLKETF